MKRSCDTCHWFDRDGEFVELAETGICDLGLAGESGEVADAVKKHLYQGHTLDLPDMKEELGDVLWYVALACKCGGFSMSDLMRGNIEKLQRRYPDGFSAERSRGRDK